MAALKRIAADDEDLIRQLVFSANLASQDAAGDLTHSMSTEDVLRGLKGTPQARSEFYALLDTETGADFALGFIQANIPLVDNRHAVDVDVFFDAELAPIPGEQPERPEVYEELVEQACRLTAALGRTHLRLWKELPTQGPFAPYDTPPAGFHQVMEEVLGFLPLPVPVLEPAATAPQTFSVEIVEDMAYSPGQLAAVLKLYEQFDQDCPTGTLNNRTTSWTPEQIEILRLDGLKHKDQHLSIFLREPGGEIVGMSVVVHKHTHERSVAAAGSTIIERSWRGKGLASFLKAQALAAASRRWPAVSRVATGFEVSNQPIAHANAALGFVPQSRTVVFEKAV